jgi:error-prone DNA polymerase
MPFASVEDVVSRAGVGRPAIEALAAANAFRGVDLGRRGALWDAAAVVRGELPLFAAADVPSGTDSGEVPGLPPEREGEAAVSDYVATGLTLGRHPLALLRPVLTELGCTDTRALRSARPGQRVRLGGMVLMRQRPGTAKGVVFVTVEDEHGVANLVVFADVAARDRQALICSRLLVVEGGVQREDEAVEVPVIHVLAGRLVDRSDLLDGLGEVDGTAG